MATSSIKLASNGRFAVWKCHGQKCWVCAEPLRLLATEIDHVLPQMLRSEPARLANLLETLGLPESFDIDGFENLLPICSPCNRRKSDRTFNAPHMMIVLQDLTTKVAWVASTAAKVKQDRSTDRILSAIFAALEGGTMSMADLERFLVDVVRAPDQVGVPDDVIILSDGYWRKRASIVAEGLCRCERATCVGADTKIYCYFHDGLPDWVVASRLYAGCYDEPVRCRRCGETHKRGDIGRDAMCFRPYSDQVARTG
jgi:5-methylcytosine-specific restriction endonuclease McrA